MKYQHKKSYLLYFIFLLISIIKTNSNSIPLQLIQPKLLESSIVTIGSISGPSTSVFALKKARSSDSLVFLSISSIDYDLIYQGYVSGYWYRYLEFTLASTQWISSSSNLNISLKFKYTALISRITFSYLIIDSKSQLFSKVKCFFQYFQPNIAYPFASNHFNITPIYFISITKFDILTQMAPAFIYNPQSFEVRWQISQGPTQNNYTLKGAITYPLYPGIYATIIHIYDDPLQGNPYKILANNFCLNDSLSTSSTFLINNSSQFSFDPNFLLGLYGLFNFSINISTFTPPNQNFKISASSINNQFYMNKALSFQYVGYQILLINEFGCPNSAFQFQKKDIDGITKCFDSCSDDEYQFYDSSSIIFSCKPCSDHNCKNCTGSDICLQCLDKYILADNQTCYLSPQYILQGSTIILCKDYPLQSCGKCSKNHNVTVCTQCQSQLYFLNVSNCVLCSSIYPNCLSCTQDQCIECENGFRFFNETKCVAEGSADIQKPDPTTPSVPCFVQYCKRCNPANYCIKCDQDQIINQNGICKSICGDGKIMLTEQCDDNNLDSHDGCSSNCTLESGYICRSQSIIIGSIYFTSVCFLKQSLSLSISIIQKLKSENKLSVQIKISPQINEKYWNQMNMSKLFDFGGDAGNKISSYAVSQIIPPYKPSRRLLQSTTQQLMLILSYNDSIQHQNLTISFNPQYSNLQLFTEIQSSYSTITVLSRNNQLVNYYPPLVYAQADILFYLSVGLGLATMGMIVLGTLMGSMMVVVQMAGVAQLAYFSLLIIGQLSPLDLALQGLKYASGYNLVINYHDIFEDTQNQQVFIGMGVYSSISDNLNISIGLIFLPLLIGLILQIVVKTTKNEQMKQKINDISFELIGSVTFYLILCFSFLISVSITINLWTQAFKTINYIFIAVCVILIIIYSVLFLKFDSEHPLFKRLTAKVKNNKKVYIFGLLILRLVSGVIIVTALRMILQPLFVLALNLIWFLLTMIVLNIYHRVERLRYATTAFILLIIQSIFLYIRIAYQQSVIEQNLSLYFNFTIIFLLFINFFVNLGVYIYSIKRLRCCQLKLQQLAHQRLLNKPINIKTSLIDNKSKRKPSELLIQNQIDNSLEKRQKNNDLIEEQMHLIIDSIEQESLKKNLKFNNNLNMKNYMNNIIEGNEDLYSYSIENQKKKLRSQINRQLKGIEIVGIKGSQSSNSNPLSNDFLRRNSIQTRLSLPGNQTQKLLIDDSAIKVEIKQTMKRNKLQRKRYGNFNQWQNI